MDNIKNCNIIHLNRYNIKLSIKILTPHIQKDIPNFLNKTYELHKKLPFSILAIHGEFVRYSMKIKYTNVNISKVFGVIEEICQYVNEKNILLKINTNYQNELLEKIIKLNCFNCIELGKLYNSMVSFSSMSCVKIVRHLNHFYSNLKLLPDNLYLLIIMIKETSNTFLELPSDVQNIIYYNYRGWANNNISNKIYYWNTNYCKFDKNDIKSILFVNTCDQITIEHLLQTELLVIDFSNECIDFSNISTNTKSIHFKSNYNSLLTNGELDYLPNSIEELSLECEFDPNVFSNLPTSIKTINIFIDNIFGNNYFPNLVSTGVEYIYIYITNKISKINKTNFIKTQFIPPKIKKISIIINKYYYPSDILYYYTDLVDKYKKIQSANFDFEIIPIDIKDFF